MPSSKQMHSAGSCFCGRDHDDAAAAIANGDVSARVDDAVDAALLTALFPQPVLRRQLLRGVGAAALLGALADMLPVAALRAMAQEHKPPEKSQITVGFLPITCATPLIMGVEKGFYEKQGLKINLQKIPGIGLIRDKMINGELDVSQQVMPVALAMSAGAGGAPIPAKVLTILNQNGNSLVLAMRHKDNRDPKNWKGFRFAVPFEQSHQALQLRAYLANAGLNPDTDASFRVVPPSDYVSNLRSDNIDGFFGGEPGGQRAVYEGAGFIHMVSGDNWSGHPCCSITALDAWIKANPNTFMAVFRGAIESGLYCSDAKNRDGMAKILAQPNYLNAPETVVEQVITGRFADGLGQVRNVPDRVNFDPFPQYSAAVWLVAQMKRWNMLKGDVDAKGLAQNVMLATDAARIMTEMGLPAPAVTFRKETIMGKEFDSNSF